MGVSGETECAPYEVLQKWDNENVELRKYPARKWVCTTSTASKIDDVMNTSFFKLFRYIRGTNAASRKVAMTKPVLTESKPAENTRQRVFTMGFYIPEEFQSNPPQPTEDGVFIHERGELKMYCRNYGGFSNDTKLCENVRKLSAALDDLGKQYDTDPFFFAGYDPPFRLFGRRNEALLIAKNV
ncbi:Heme-binding protein 2 [Fasciola hepatica]|uniref:Heme-binding protein 1 n=1 Tax=Fasciola hepatica TaxID=6192 RepID=A0A4E0REF1_FASHE|nr:Heme-binding protein 2 [Fasciola hepatica]